MHSVNGSGMSTYPRNSPHAAARILALALISNGKVQSSELDALEAHDANGQLGITNQEWHDVVHDLCVHLLSTASRGTQCVIDSRLIESILDRVDDAALQRRVLRLCLAVVHADGKIDEGESVVLRAAIDRWELHSEEQSLVEPLLYGLDFEVVARWLHRATADPREFLVPSAMLLGGPRENSRTD